MLPPLYGTNLFATYNESREISFYCPKMKDELIWIDSKFVVPPMFHCIFQLLSQDINEDGEITDLENVTISVHDLGGDETVRYVCDGAFGYKFIESFDSLIQVFKDQGYHIKEDLFAVPYDWRKAIAGLGKFWDDFKNLTEYAYEKNHEPVTLFGFSTGGFILQHFLANKVSKEWKDKYIDRAVFLAPSFGGAGSSIYAIWLKIFPVIPFYNSEDLDRLIQTSVVVHAHLPNHVIFGNETIITGPYGDEYKASELRDVYIEHDKFSEKYIPLFDKSVEVSKLAPIGPDVPCYIIYNTGIDTKFYMKFNNGWNKVPKIEPIAGDGTVAGRGPEWACKNWNTKYGTVQCMDLYRDDPTFEHQPLASNPYVHKLIYNITTSTEWIHRKGRRFIRAPYVEVINKTHYSINEKYRPEKLLYESSE